MTVIEKLSRFARKPLPDQWAAIRVTFGIGTEAAERRCRARAVATQQRLHDLLTGAHAPPRVLQSDEKMYIAHRPDSDAHYKQHPEVAALSEKWIKDNLTRNAGDLPR